LSVAVLAFKATGKDMLVRALDLWLDLGDRRMGYLTLSEMGLLSYPVTQNIL
jgi:hypothetical protein